MLLFFFKHHVISSTHYESISAVLNVMIVRIEFSRSSASSQCRHGASCALVFLSTYQLKVIMKNLIPPLLGLVKAEHFPAPLKLEVVMKNLTPPLLDPVKAEHFPALL